jgi:hyperosmotically inducible periplasmic protein
MKRMASALFAITLVAPLGSMACGGAATTRAAVSAPVDDATITTRVKTALLNEKGMDPTRIDVQTFNGVVTLTGKVKNKEDESKAVALARSIRGVTDVKSSLQVE